MQPLTLVDVDGVTYGVYPYWDGRFMHLAELVTEGMYYRPRCSAPWAPRSHGQLIGNGVPTCLWCVTDRRYA